MSLYPKLLDTERVGRGRVQRVEWINKEIKGKNSQIGVREIA